MAAGLSDCPGEETGGRCAAFRTVGLLLTAGTWTGLGAGMDALIAGRTTVYAAPALPAEARVERSRGPGGAALRLSVGW